MSCGILFLCTGDASRSRMAEGFARRLPRTPSLRRGTSPRGVEPRGVSVMGEMGVDISEQRCKPSAASALDQPMSISAPKEAS